MNHRHAAMRRDLLTIFRTALERVDGRRCVASHLSARRPPGNIHLVAVGKASGAMAAGAFDVLDRQIVAALVVNHPAYLDAGLLRGLPVTFVEGAHPIPAASSLAAGEALSRFLEAAPAEARFLFLISGGTSSLVEVLAPGVGLDDLQRLNQWLLGSGLDIHQMNALRKGVSAIKGGGLGAYLAGREADALYISDVPGDDPAVIGSGLLAATRDVVMPHGLPAFVRALLAKGAAGARRAEPLRVSHHIVASLSDAREAAARKARDLGYAVIVHPDLVDGDALAAGTRLAQAVLAGPVGVQIWGGETTVQLPPNPGCGGRNQSLALAAAVALRDCPDAAFLAAGTDGKDGNSPAAGAIVDGRTVARAEAQGLAAAASLAAADAGTFLQASGDALILPPTHTNVMDLMIGLRPAV